MGAGAAAVVDEVVVAMEAEAEAEAASDASDDCPLAPGRSRGLTRSRAWAAVEAASGAGADIEPCPLLVLEPLLLQVQGAGIHQGARGSAGEAGGRRKETLSPSEQQKVARIMIGYTLAFFALAILTFYIVYFV